MNHYQIDRPLKCRRDAFDLMRRLAPQIESSLMPGAVAITMMLGPDGSLGDVAANVQYIARTVRKRVNGSQPQALLAHLHAVLFDEMKFRGDTKTYHAVENSSISGVLKKRTGLPITLSLIYKLVADQIGLKVRGVGLPGHFCVGVEMSPDDLMIVDPFYCGRVLNRKEAADRIANTYGKPMDVNDDLLQPVTVRHWLTRILQNLMHTFQEKEDLGGVLQCLELEIVLWPEHQQLARDYGLVLARAGMAEPAKHALTHYLRENESDPQRADIMALMAVLSC